MRKLKSVPIFALILTLAAPSLAWADQKNGSNSGSKNNGGPNQPAGVSLAKGWRAPTCRRAGVIDREMPRRFYADPCFPYRSSKLKPGGSRKGKSIAMGLALLH